MCQFLVILALKYVALGSFLIESENLIPKMGTTETKGKINLGKFWLFIGCNIAFSLVKILFIKMGFSSLVVSYTSVNRFIVFNVDNSTIA